MWKEGAGVSVGQEESGRQGQVTLPQGLMGGREGAPLTSTPACPANPQRRWELAGTDTSLYPESLSLSTRERARGSRGLLEDCDSQHSCCCRAGHHARRAQAWTICRGLCCWVPSPPPPSQTSSPLTPEALALLLVPSLLPAGGRVGAPLPTAGCKSSRRA